MAEVRPVHVFSLLALFWVAWIYSELRDYWQWMDQYGKITATLEEIQAFKEAGPRFTAEDGAELEARIEAIEDRLEAYEGL